MSIVFLDKKCWSEHQWHVDLDKFLYLFQIYTHFAGHKTALQNLDAVRVAVNRVYGDLATPIGDRDEVAFFPPVTGG